MDQVKIGKFIAKMRKEKSLTQAELANKLGITDRAVSKWENGRGLPDLSLIKPLCDALDITANDLLSGEILEEKDICSKSEENIIETLKYSTKKIKNIKNRLLSVIISIVCALILLVTCFAVDISKMRNNKPVVFSNWGFEYAPPVDFTEYELEISIKKYLVNLGDNEYHHEEGVKTFIALKTYLTVAANEDGIESYTVYAWVLSEQCYKSGNDIMNYGSYSIPYKFTLLKDNTLLSGEYMVTSAEFPRDGYYSEDFKKIFPKSVRKDMDLVHKDGSIEILQNEINEQVELYFE